MRGRKKRFFSAILAIAVFFACAAAGETGVVSGITSYELYGQMLLNFEDGDYEGAYDKAVQLYGSDPTYEKTAWYRDYLMALCDYLPQGRYNEAFRTFAILSSSKFEKSEGYMHYSLGMLQMQERDFESALESFYAAMERDVVEAKGMADRCWEIIHRETAVRVTETRTELTRITVSWEDSADRDFYTISWHPAGMPGLKESMEVYDCTVTLEGLLPNTEYLVTVSADETDMVETGCITAEAGDSGAYGMKYIMPKVDGKEELPVEARTGGRKPTDSGTPFVFRMSFSYARQEKDQKVKTLWVLHMGGRSCALETVETLPKGSAAAWQIPLGRLLDLLYENGAVFTDGTVLLEVYVEKDSWELALKQDILTF